MATITYFTRSGTSFRDWIVWRDRGFDPVPGDPTTFESSGRTIAYRGVGLGEDAVSADDDPFPDFGLLEGYDYRGSGGEIALTVDGLSVDLLGLTDTPERNLYETLWAFGGGDDVVDGRLVGGRLDGFWGDDVLHLGYDRFRGSSGYGGEGNDTIFGSTGRDTIFGGYGDDSILAGDGADILLGGAGNDTIDGGASIDTLIWRHLDDTEVRETLTHLADGYAETVRGRDVLMNIENVTGSPWADTMYGTDDRNLLKGVLGDDALYGLGGPDTLYGAAGNDTLSGGAGTDFLYGGRGDDVFIGGPGQDRLDASNGGADTFVFETLDDSGLGFAQSDRIVRFRFDDLIDLTAIDANPFVEGDQAFTWTEGGLTGTPGEVSVVIDREVNINFRRIDLDADGDGLADMQIFVFGSVGADSFLF